MRASISIALFTAGAVVCHSLPVRAMPGPSINLVRIDGEGVQPLPDITRVLRELEAAQTAAAAQTPEPSPVPSPAPAPLLAQAMAEGVAGPNTGIFFLPSGDEDLRIRLSAPLPAGTSGELLLRVQRSPWKAATSGPEAGEIEERINLTSTQVTLSADRRYLQINPERTLLSGEVLTVDLSALSATARPETPVRFALPDTACLFQAGDRTKGDDQKPDDGSRSALLGEEDDDVVFLLSAGDDLEISFTRPLPSTISGSLLLRDQPAPGGSQVTGPAAGDVVERISVTSPQVFRSEDGLFMAITPESRRTLGWITTVDLSELSAGTDPETPVRFTLARPACPIARRRAPCPIAPLPGASTAAAAATPGWLVPALVGLVIIGVGAAIIAGSDGDSDGGGTPSR
ncbi:MAG: hypothetical protein AB1Z21_05445 [Synechococcaceae cyanobacterium]